jgi:rhomboid family GlyGly-CTERM serine protease
MASLAAWGGPHGALEWQPALWLSQPWRAWTAATVHYSTLHLAANLAGVLLVGALGAVADLRPHNVMAWVLAWPLTQLGLLWRPELLHFGGLSGVLHAGVAVVALQLIIAGPRQRRGIGLAILLVLVGKVLSESPWGPALRRPEGWDIAVAPFAHASGVVCGLVCAAVCARIASWWERRAHD